MLVTRKYLLVYMLGTGISNFEDSTANTSQGSNMILDLSDPVLTTSTLRVEQIRGHSWLLSKLHHCLVRDFLFFIHFVWDSFKLDFGDDEVLKKKNVFGPVQE